MNTQALSLLERTHNFLLSIYDAKFGEQDEYAEREALIAECDAAIAAERSKEQAKPQPLEPLSDDHPLKVFARECALGCYAHDEIREKAKAALNARAIEANPKVRPLKPLSDEELVDIVGNCADKSGGWFRYHAFARAIEAKLGVGK